MNVNNNNHNNSHNHSDPLWLLFSFWKRGGPQCLKHAVEEKKVVWRSLKIWWGYYYYLSATNG